MDACKKRGNGKSFNSQFKKIPFLGTWKIPSILDSFPSPDKIPPKQLHPSTCSRGQHLGDTSPLWPIAERKDNIGNMRIREASNPAQLWRNYLGTDVLLRPSPTKTPLLLLGGCPHPFVSTWLLGGKAAAVGIPRMDGTRRGEGGGDGIAEPGVSLGCRSGALGATSGGGRVKGRQRQG